MNPAKTFIFFIILLAFAVCVLAQKSNSLSNRITSRDKSKIINQVFADGFGKLMQKKDFYQCTIPIINNRKIILIKSREPNIFPKVFEEYDFRIMNGNEIENEIKSNNGDCYYELSIFQAKDSNRVKISLWRKIEVITVVNGQSWYPSRYFYGKGLVYEATKANNKWDIRFLSITRAVS